jgi:hypothetical protein
MLDQAMYDWFILLAALYLVPFVIHGIIFLVAKATLASGWAFYSFLLWFAALTTLK